MRPEVLGVQFDPVTLDGAVERALALMEQRRSAYVCTPNPEIVWRCRRDEALRAAVAGADLTLADGVGIVWAAKRLGTPVPERVTGYDFMMALLARFSGRLYMLGGEPGVAEAAAQTIRRRFPAVEICGCRNGFFDGDEAVLGDIQAAAPDFLVVCMGSPRQENWMAANRGRLDVGLMAGLGGCLDVLSGRVKRAPAWWIRWKLEWLYRLIRQPGRLKRQLCLPAFVLAVLAEREKRKGAPRSPRDKSGVCFSSGISCRSRSRNRSRCYCCRCSRSRSHSRPPRRTGGSG